MATIQIPLTLNVPDSTGNGYPLLVYTNPHRAVVAACLKDVAGYWYSTLRVPQDYVGTPKVIMSIAANATSGATRLAVSSYRVADTASYDGTYTTETAQDITVPGTAYNRKDVTFSVTTSSIAAGDDLMIRLDHEGAHANDTLAVDTLIYNAVFQYANA